MQIYIKFINYTNVLMHNRYDAFYLVSFIMYI
jgi:hypothetical protein